MNQILFVLKRIIFASGILINFIQIELLWADSRPCELLLVKLLVAPDRDEQLLIRMDNINLKNRSADLEEQVYIIKGLNFDPWPRNVVDPHQAAILALSNGKSSLFEPILSLTVQEFTQILKLISIRAADNHFIILYSGRVALRNLEFAKALVVQMKNIIEWHMKNVESTELHKWWGIYPEQVLIGVESLLERLNGVNASMSLFRPI